MDFLQWVPLLSVLGVGGAIVGWVGAGKARRELRSAVLNAITVVEAERWARDPDSADYPKFVAAVHDLETAALVARIPRIAVRHYVVLAEAARQLSDDAVDFDDADQTFWGGIDGYDATLFAMPPKVLTQLAWSARLARGRPYQGTWRSCADEHWSLTTPRSSGGSPVPRRRTVVFPVHSVSCPASRTLRSTPSKTRSQLSRRGKKSTHRNPIHRRRPGESTQLAGTSRTAFTLLSWPDFQSSR